MLLNYDIIHARPLIQLLIYQCISAAYWWFSPSRFTHPEDSFMKPGMIPCDTPKPFWCDQRNHLKFPTQSQYMFIQYRGQTSTNDGTQSFNYSFILCQLPTPLSINTHLHALLHLLQFTPHNSIPHPPSTNFPNNAYYNLPAACIMAQTYKSELDP